MPIGPWATFAECVAHIRSKGNYDEDTAKKVCGKLEQQLANKYDGWVEERSWEENDRVFEGYITADRVDKQVERIPLDKAIEAMPSYFKTGTLNDSHTNQIRGRPLAWKIVGKRILVKFGVYDRMPGDTKFWERIKALEKKGALSIGGEPVGGKKIVCQGDHCYLEPKGVAFFEVSFVDNKPANLGAKVTDINRFVKGEDMEKQEPRRDGVPKDDVERAMKHFGLTREQAERMLREGALKLPPRGTGLTRFEGDLEKIQQVLGKEDATVSAEDVDLLMEDCETCKKMMESVEGAGFEKDMAQEMVRAWLIHKFTVNPASPEAGSTNTGEEDMKPEEMEELVKRVTEAVKTEVLKQEEAPPEEPPAPENGEAGGERDLGSEFDQLSAKVEELAGLVSSALEKLTGTEESVEEEAEEAAAVEEEVADIGEGAPAAAGAEAAKAEKPTQKGKKPETPKDEESELEKLKKTLKEPARPPRGATPPAPGKETPAMGKVAEIITKSVNAGKAGIPDAKVLLEGADDFLQT